MIILIEKNFPVIVMIFDKFEELEYKTFKKNLEYFDKKSREDNCCLKLYIDLYNLNDNYSIHYLNELVSYINGKYFPNLDNIKIFINKNNTSFFLKSYAYMNQMIQLIELDKPRDWR